MLSQAMTTLHAVASAAGERRQRGGLEVGAPRRGCGANVREQTRGARVGAHEKPPPPLLLSPRLRVSCGFALSTSVMNAFFSSGVFHRQPTRNRSIVYSK